jgi:hypothetical protein
MQPEGIALEGAQRVTGNELDRKHLREQPIGK